MPGWWAEKHTAVSGATITTTGGTPTLTISGNRVLTPTGALLTATGGAPTIVNPYLLTPQQVGSVPSFPHTFPFVFTGVLTIIGRTPSVNIGRTIVPAAASLTATGGTPTVTVSNHKIVSPTAGAASFTGGVPTIIGRTKPFIVGTPNHGSSNTVAIPTHAVGDLILIYAFARNSATAPTIPSASGTVPAWVSRTVGPGSGICNGRTATFVATATNHTSGTWSGASGMIATVIRGQDAAPIGGSGSTGGSTLDCTAPAVTLSDPSGYSLILHHFGARSGAAAVTWGSAPSGYTQKAAESTGGVCLDSKDVTTTDGAVTQTRTGATAGYDGHTLEILSPSPEGAIVPTGPSGAWTLMFNDDFNDSSLDTTKWRTSWYSGTNNVSSSTANITVADSRLFLKLSNSTTGAIVTTQPGGGTTGFKIGAECVWEARILFPADGTHIYNWPAFWVLNDVSGDVLCEIDIAEPWDGEMQTNYHCGSSNPSHSYSGYADGQFHIWTLRRTATTMYFYVDGSLVYTLAKDSTDNGHPQYCIINVGRTSSGLYTVYGSGSEVQVDYVRAWQPS